MTRYYGCYERTNSKTGKRNYFKFEFNAYDDDDARARAAEKLRLLHVKAEYRSTGNCYKLIYLRDY